jgi:multiple sugar transport system substrate-binding protein
LTAAFVGAIIAPLLRGGVCRFYTIVQEVQAMIKKMFLAAILTVFAIFTLFANGKSEPSASAKVTLDFPSWQATEPGFSQFWQDAMQGFAPSHPNVTIHLYQVTFKDYIDTLTTRFAANNPPDITHLPARNFAQFASQGWLASLDSRLAKTDILANWTPLQQSMVYQGKMEGLLLMGYGYLFFYNEKMLSDAGLKVPTTLDEVVADAKSLTNPSAGIYGFGQTTEAHPDVYTDIASLVYGQGLSFEKNGQYQFTDPDVMSIIDKYRELANYSPKGIPIELKRQLFADGKIAMTIDGPWVIALLDKAKPEVKPYLKYGLLPLKSTSGGPSNSVHIAVNVNEAKQNLAWDFIQSLTTVKMQQEYTLNTTSPAPRKGVLTPDLLAKQPALGTVNQAAAGAVSTFPVALNLQTNYALYAKTVTDAMIQLMTTNDPTRAVMEQLQSKLMQLIKS